MSEKKPNTIRDKSFAFAVRVVKLYRLLSTEKREFVMSKQLLRSATSVGANVREAINAESKKDFIHKLAIAQKEADESYYWIELLKATDFITETEFESLSTDITELLKILKSIILTTKQKMNS